MRNFTKPLAALLLGFVYTAQAQTTQTVEDDFEGNGTITNWYGDDCGLDTDKANPVAEGDNTSATVLEYSDTGGQYANVQFTVPAKFNLSETHTFSLRIYVPSEGLTGSQNNQVSLKLQNADLGESWTTQSEIIKDISLDSWQTVTFDFANDEYVNFDPTSPAPTLRSDFDKVVLQVNGEDNNDHVLAYVDDFLWDGTLTITDDGGDDGGNGGEDDGDEGDGELDSIPMHDEFKYLVWSDEFDGDGALDPEKWHHQTQLPEGGSWFNGEIQHYTNRTENSYQADGNLNLVLKRENFTDQGQTKTFTSARLNSKFAFTYGRVEVRAILPEGVGTWPAIWMLGKNINEAGAYWQEQGFGTTTWPACCEIDIMEHWGDNQDFVQAA
ncbi:MAG TPA: beta-glucanase, partial [Cytophagales bacterium]|nr:beta-glucanase [Cytophagales bacterium]